MRYLPLIMIFFVSCVKEAPPQNTELLELRKAQPDLNELFPPEIEIFFLEYNKVSMDSQIVSYTGLHYEPISSTYLMSTMSNLHMEIEDVLPYLNTNKKPHRYLINEPFEDSYFSYVGELDLGKNIYSNYNNLFIQQLIPLEIKVYVDKKTGERLPYFSVSPVLVTNSDSSEQFFYIDNYNSVYTNVLLLETNKIQFMKKLEQSDKKIVEHYFPYVAPQLTNGNEKSAQIIEDIKAKKSPYEEMNFSNYRKIPLLLKILLDASKTLSYSQTNESETFNKLIEQYTTVYHKKIETNFINVFEYVCAKRLPIFLKSFTNFDITAVYQKSLENCDVWECYMLEMPKFQELLKQNIPMPKDLLISEYRSNDSNIMTPVIHFLARRGYKVPLFLMLEKVPDYDISVTNDQGLTISQVAIKSGAIDFLQAILADLTNINVHEVTPSNETWLDLAYQLPLYNFYAYDEASCHKGKTRKTIIEELAPKYGITQNINLEIRMIFDPERPNSLTSLQAKYMEKNRDFEPIQPYQLRKEHQWLFNENIPETLNLAEFIVIDPDTFHFYPQEVFATYIKLVKFLVEEAGVEYTSLDKSGNNLLGVIVQTPQKELFDFFIEKGLSPHHINYNNENLLHLAFISTDSSYEYSYEDIYGEKLLELKLDINLVNFDGYTPYSQYISGACASQETADLLIKYGANVDLGKRHKRNDVCVG